MTRCEPAGFARRTRGQLRCKRHRQTNRTTHPLVVGVPTPKAAHRARSLGVRWGAVFLIGDDPMSQRGHRNAQTTVRRTNKSLRRWKSSRWTSTTECAAAAATPGITPSCT